MTIHLVLDFTSYFSLLTGVRLIPFNTLAQQSILIDFPQRVFLLAWKKKKKKNTSAKAFSVNIHIRVARTRDAANQPNRTAYLPLVALFRPNIVHI